MKRAHKNGWPIQLPQIVNVPNKGLSHELFIEKLEESAQTVWQEMYLKKTSVRVKEIIPCVSKPIEMEMNFFLAQGLCGVGCFRSYLHKIGKVSNPRCPFGHEKQSAEALPRLQ